MAFEPNSPIKPVLIVQHAPHEHPAIIRRALETQGIATRCIHPYRGDQYPSVDQILGMVSMGGPMSANDESEHPWITQEIKLLRSCVEAGLPVLGVCLGGQMLARAMGSPVGRNAQAEVGWFPIRPTSAGREDPIFGGAGNEPLVYHWHEDTFELPAGAVLLADSQACPRQAYRLGERIYGFQFHPEADHQLVHEWMAIEGVEEEILDAQKQHGIATVQDAQTQKSRASQGERASLRITAAVTQIFQTAEYEDIPDKVRLKLENWTTHQQLLLLEFEDPHGHLVHLRGQIAQLFHLTGGEFLIFKEESTLLWPIRMDFIRNIRAIKN